MLTEVLASALVSGAVPELPTLEQWAQWLIATRMPPDADSRL